MTIRLSVSALALELSSVRLPPASAVPVVGGAFFSLARTADELLLVCETQAVPDELRPESGWTALRLHVPPELTLTAGLAAALSALAAAGVECFTVSTFDTDHVLVNGVQLAKTVQALREAGHTVL